MYVFWFTYVTTHCSYNLYVKQYICNLSVNTFTIYMSCKLWHCRFGIEKITEFYGATEGNANAVNSDNTVGCVGFTSMIAPSMHPISVILVDKDTGEPLRGELSNNLVTQLMRATLVDCTSPDVWLSFMKNISASCDKKQFYLDL